MALEFLRPLFGNFDPNLIVYGAFFFIFFALIYFILSRVFKDQYGNTNKAIAGIISFSVSALIIYYGENFLNNLLFNLNFNTDIIYWLGGIAFIIFLIITTKMLGFGGLLSILGTGFILSGVFDLVFKKGFVIAVGSGLLLIGILILFRKKKPLSEMNLGGKTTKNIGLFIFWCIVLAGIVWLAVSGVAFYLLGIIILAGFIWTLFRWKKKIGKGISRRFQNNPSWGQEQLDVANKQRRQQRKEQRRFERRQRKEQARLERQRQKEMQRQDQGMAGISDEEQRKEAKRQRKLQRKQQKEFERQQKIEEAKIRNQQIAEAKKEELARAYADKELRKRQEETERQRQKEMQKIQEIKQDRINRLEKMYGQKNRELQKYAMLAAKGDPKAQRKANQLQQEIQNIVDGVNKIRNA